MPSLPSGTPSPKAPVHTRAALERHQQRLAREQMRWVAAHSPAVAARFRAAGLGLSQWRSLPPTGKAEMMAQFDDLNTAGLKLADVLALARSAEDRRDFSGQLRGAASSAFAGQPLTVGLSSGTSGTQGAFLVGTTERQRWAGVVLRHLLPPPFFRSRCAPKGGLPPAGRGRALPQRAEPPDQLFFLDLLRPVPELAAALSAADPTLLVGPPSVLRALLEAGAVARPQRVVCVAEVLEPDDRAALEAGFGPVVQVYQATEELLALPCPHGHLHLNEAHVHFDLEALGDGRRRPIITDLRRRVQPMIRHRLDDILQLDSAVCPCGSAARRVIRIEGRQDDALSFASPSGSLVTVWPNSVRAVNRVPGLREYRAEQTAPHTLRLLLDPDSPEVRTHAAAEVAAALTRAGADAGGVHLTFGPLLPAPPGTKRRRVLRRREENLLPLPRSIHD